MHALTRLPPPHWQGVCVRKRAFFIRGEGVHNISQDSYGLKKILTLFWLIVDAIRNKCLHLIKLSVLDQISAQVLQDGNS